MNCLLSGAFVYSVFGFEKKDILIKDGVIFSIADKIIPDSNINVFEFNNCYIFPGLIDVHVHLREPGFFYKESIKTGSMAAARGGFTCVCAMPNLIPVPDNAEHLKIEEDIISRDAIVHVYPYGSITVSESQKQLSDMSAMATSVIAFSDDGVGVESGEMMRNAMLEAKKHGKIIAAHCEDKDFVTGGYVHDGMYAREHGLVGLSSESEWRQLYRDIKLAKETGCSYHVCHVSAKESVELIRRAKAKGIDISCETAPHYLTLCDENIKDDGCFRMNPPLRSPEDRAALIEGIIDGTIDMIATDHAPHSETEKLGGLENSLNGIVGLETAFPVLYTKLVRTGIISLKALIQLFHDNPKKRFAIGTELAVGESADITVFDLNREYIIDTAEFLSKGRSSPFVGERVFGKCLMTLLGGKTVYDDGR